MKIPQIKRTACTQGGLFVLALFKYILIAPYIYKKKYHEMIIDKIKNGE